MSSPQDHNDDIGELIKQESDPKNRAFLIILQNINLSLIANTQTVNEIDGQLKEHLEEFRARATAEDAAKNEGKGAWRVISWLLGSAQAIVVSVVIVAYTEIRDLKVYSVEVEQRLHQLEETVKPAGEAK